MSKVADNWHKEWYLMLYKEKEMEHTTEKWSFQQGAGRQYHIKDENNNTLALVTGRTNAERICKCVNGWDELMAQKEEYRKCHESELGVCQQHCDIVNELQARLETAERLVLQGGAGHDAIVEKAVELQKQKTAAELTVKALKFANGEFAKENKNLVKQRDALLKACEEHRVHRELHLRGDYSNRRCEDCDLHDSTIYQAISLCEK